MLFNTNIYPFNVYYFIDKTCIDKKKQFKRFRLIEKQFKYLAPPPDAPSQETKEGRKQKRKKTQKYLHF